MLNSGIRFPRAATGFDQNSGNITDNTAAADDDTSATMIMFSGATDVGFASNFSVTSLDDLPEGSTVTGIEIIIKAGWAFSANSGVISVGINGSNGGYGSTNAAVNFDVADGADSTIHTLGSESNLFGIDWSGFTDMSNLAVRLSVSKSDGGTGTTLLGVFFIRARVFYNQYHPPIFIKSGKLTVKGGTLTIK